MAIHEDFSRRHEIRGSSERTFGLLLGAALALAGVWPLRTHQPVRPWACVAGGAFLAIGLAAPSVLRPLNRAWTRLGLLLGRITNPIVTALLFFVILTPIALVRRVLGKDVLRLKLDAAAQSYWIERHEAPSGPTSMSNQF